MRDQIFRIFSLSIAIVGGVWFLGLFFIFIFRLPFYPPTYPLRDMVRAFLLILSAAVLYPDSISFIVRHKYSGVIVIVGMAIFWCVAKFAQQKLFCLSALDFGIYKSILINLVNGVGAVDNVLQNSAFDGHFEPIMLLLAYPAKIIGAETIMIISQSLAFVTAFLIACITGKRLGNNFAILVVPVLAFTFFVNEVHRFDFHPETLAIPSTLGMLFLIGRKSFWSLLLFALLGIWSAMTKKSAFFALLGVAIAALIQKEREYFVVALLISLLCLGSFFLFSAGSADIPSDRYGFSPTSFSPKILWTFIINITKPIKFPYLLRLIMSFGMGLISPAGITALPSVFLEFASRYKAQWTFTHQYSALVIPFALWGTSIYVKNPKIIKWHIFLVLFIAALNLPSYLYPRTTFHHASVIRRAISLIPSNEPVIAGDALFVALCDGKRQVRPLLSSKDFVAGSYIIIDTKRGTYPFNEDEITSIISTLFRNRKICLYFYEDGVMIFKILGKGSERKGEK